MDLLKRSFSFDDFFSQFRKSFYRIPYEDYPNKYPESYKKFTLLSELMRKDLFNQRHVKESFDSFPYCNFKIDKNKLISDLGFLIENLPLKEFKVVYSAGTGPGLIESYLKLNYFQNSSFFCSDLSINLLNSTVNKINGRNQLIPINADAASLPIKDLSIDLYISLYCYHYLPNVKKGFEETQRVLKDGGYAFITFNELYFGRFINWQSYIKPNIIIIANECIKYSGPRKLDNVLR